MQAMGETCFINDDAPKTSVTFPSVDPAFKSDLKAFLVVRPYKMLQIGRPQEEVHHEDIGIVVGATKEQVQAVFGTNHLVLPVGLIDLKKFIATGGRAMAIATAEQKGQLEIGDSLKLSAGE